MSTLLKETRQKISPVFVHIRIFMNKDFASVTNAEKAYHMIFDVVSQLSPEEGSMLDQILSEEQYAVIKEIAKTKSFEAYSSNLVPRHLQHRRKALKRHASAIENVFGGSEGTLDFSELIEESLKEVAPVENNKPKAAPKTSTAFADLQARMRQKMQAAQGKVEEPDPKVEAPMTEPEEDGELGDETTLSELQAIQARLAQNKAMGAARTRTRTRVPDPTPAPEPTPAPKALTEEEKVAAQMAALRNKLGNKTTGAGRTRTR